MVRHLDMFTSATRHQNTGYGLSQPYSTYATSVQPYNNGQNENIANVVGSMDSSTFQQNLAWSTVYTVPSGSCSRQSVVYEEWIPPNSPCSQQAPAFTYAPAYTLQRNATGGEQHDFPGPPSLLIQDLASTGQPDGQPSPDSVLAVSSDGLSGSESPGIPLHLGIPQQGGQALCRPQPARSPFEWMKKSPYQPNPGKTRTKDKYRVVYTDHQRLELEKEFHYSRYITIRRKTELAAMLGLSERQVKIWFQNRRAKERKQAKKREEVLQKGKDPMLQQNAAIAALNLFKPIVHFDQEHHHVQMNRIE